jgi:hypothetical protein
MSLFSEYEKLLSMEFSMDYWSDEIIDEAISIMNKFDDKDWELILDNWSNKDTVWKERCAATLSATQPEKSLSILLSMLNSESGEVLEAVVDSLYSLAQDNIQINLSSEQLTKLRKLSTTGKIYGIIVSNLLEKLNS